MKVEEKARREQEVEYEGSRLRFVSLIKDLVTEQNALESEVRETAMTAAEELQHTRSMLTGLKDEVDAYEESEAELKKLREEETRSRDTIIHDLLSQLVSVRAEKSRLQRTNSEQVEALQATNASLRCRTRELRNAEWLCGTRLLR